MVARPDATLVELVDRVAIATGVRYSPSPHCRIRQRLHLPHHAFVIAKAQKKDGSPPAICLHHFAGIAAPVAREAGSLLKLHITCWL